MTEENTRNNEDTGLKGKKNTDENEGRDRK
jgi:hypothetical protein